MKKCTGTIVFIVLMSICCMYFIFEKATTTTTVRDSIVQKGIVIDKICHNYVTTHIPTNRKTYTNICRLKIKWDNNVTTTDNYNILALEGDCVEKHKVVYTTSHFNDIEHVFTHSYLKHYK